MKTDPSRGEETEQILRLRTSGLTLRAIGQRVGLSHTSVSNRIAEALGELVTPAAEELRRLELERLDRLTVAATEVLERHHVTVSNGKVIYLDDRPLIDDGPVLAAVDRLTKLSESRRKLLGLDAPKQLDVALEQRLDVEAGVVGEVLGEVVDSVTEALYGVLSPQQQKDLFDYVRAMARWRLLQVGEQDPGPRPVAPALAGAVPVVSEPERDLMEDYRAFCAAEGVDPDEDLDDEEDDDDE